MDGNNEMLKKVEADNENDKTHFFRNQQQSTYTEDAAPCRWWVSILKVRTSGVYTGTLQGKLIHVC